MKTTFFFGLFLIGMASTLFGQGPDDTYPRLDDHFWRRRVQMQVDLEEKMNRPLQPRGLENRNNILFPNGKEGEDRGPDRRGQPNFQYYDGLVNTLYNLYKEQQITGYVPDTLHKPLEFSEMQRRFKLSSEEADGGDQENIDGGEGDDGLGGGFGDDFGDDFGGDFGDFGGGEDDLGGSSAAEQEQKDKIRKFRNELQSKIYVIEDRIFDKNKSAMYYDIRYLKLYQLPTTAEIPPREVVAFKWDDVKSYLDQAQWPNFQNNVQDKSLKDVFELRLFHGFITHVSTGDEQMDIVMELSNAKRRRLQMIEFEHNLWEF